MNAWLIWLPWEAFCFLPGKKIRVKGIPEEGGCFPHHVQESRIQVLGVLRHGIRPHVKHTSRLKALDGSRACIEAGPRRAALSWRRECLVPTLSQW